MALSVVGKVIRLYVHDAALIDMRWSVYVASTRQVSQPGRWEALNLVVINHGLTVIFFCSSLLIFLNLGVDPREVNCYIEITATGITRPAANEEQTMTIMTLTSASGSETTVKVVRETAKAILVKGNCSEAWFLKSAIDNDGFVADWFRGSLSHSFLWEAPWDEAKRIQSGAAL